MWCVSMQENIILFDAEINLNETKSDSLFIKENGLLAGGVLPPTRSFFAF